MGQNNTLGDAGCSAGILIHGNIVKGDFYFRRIRLILGDAIHPAIDVRGSLNISEGEFLQLFPKKSFNWIKKVADTHINDLLDLSLGPQINHAIAKSIKSN